MVIPEREEMDKPGLGIHIDYYHLTSSDLSWLFGIIKRAIIEVRLQNKGRRWEEALPKRIPLQIISIQTEDSIDVNVFFGILETAYEGMQHIVVLWAFYELARRAFRYLRKESEEKRYVSRRPHIKQITVKGIKKKYDTGELIEEDEFLLQIKESQY